MLFEGNPDPHCRSCWGSGDVIVSWRLGIPVKATCHCVKHISHVTPEEATRLLAAMQRKIDADNELRSYALARFRGQ